MVTLNKNRAKSITIVAVPAIESKLFPLEWISPKPTYPNKSQVTFFKLNHLIFLM